MALSFRDSLNENAVSRIAGRAAPSAASGEENTAAAAKISGAWIRNDTIYEWDEEYHDDQYSSVDANKNITVSSSQISVTQEKNSQYIPFLLDRYWDGVDLSEMTFAIHGVNKNKEEFRDVPINFEYNDTSIRFGWLLSEFACSAGGDLQFEIEAYGTNKKNKNYKWITRPNGKLNVIQSLCGSGASAVKPSDDWITTFLNQATAKVEEVQAAAQEARSAVSEAQSLADQASQAASDAQSVVASAKSELEAAVEEAAAASLENYYTKSEVDLLLKELDLSDVYDAIQKLDGLENFNTSYDSETRTMTFYNGSTVIKSETLNSDPSPEWTSSFTSAVDGKITAAVSAVQSDFDAYKKASSSSFDDLRADIAAAEASADTNKTNISALSGRLAELEASDGTNKTNISALGGRLAELEASDGTNKTNISALGGRLAELEASDGTNKTNISALGGKLAELEASVDGLDTAPRVTYEATYDEEQIYTLWEIEGEGDDEVRTPKGQFKLQGGGSGGTSSVLKIEYVTKTPLTVTVHDRAVIKFRFSGTDSSGDAITEGTASWRVGNSAVASQLVVEGENSFDITDYLSLGTQKVTLSITDDAGSLVTKSWTVQKLDIRIESGFHDQLAYPMGTVSFDYTPYGAVSKDIHFVLDGKELAKVTAAASGIPMTYPLPAQPHGSHLLDVYMTAEINGSVVESNHITKDIIWYDASCGVPVIGCAQQEFTAKQYDTANIIYTVYDPQTEAPKVTLSIDGEAVSVLTLDSNTQIWQYKAASSGTHTLTIACRDTVKTLTVTVEKLDIDVTPVTAGLAFDFNPSGRSNNDDDRLWSDGNVAMTVSDNFDWVNGGYQIDKNGDQYFCVKAGTSAVIHYKLFEDDAKRNGKEFKLIFKTTNVCKADTTFLSCLDGSIGLQMNVHEAYIKAGADSLYLPYSEEDIIEFEFNINKNTDIPMVMGYEDGVASRPMIYGDSHDFTQIHPQVISIGSDSCDVLIYRMKAYAAALTDRGILNNFISDARNADEMLARYHRNKIYDENNLLTPESLAKACPQLKVIKLECPHFTNDKKDFVKYTNIECIHTGGDPVYDNWTAKNAYHSGQGTTSNEYGAAGRNIDLLMCFDGEYTNSKIAYDPDYKTILTLGDGTKYEDGTGKIALTRTSVPTNYFNIKVNIASSENANNAQLQNRYNTYLPYKSTAQQNDSRIKNSMEFVNCVLFVKESDPDISSHREFDDTEWHFYAIGNLGDSKKTDASRVNDASDPKEFVVEILDNTLPNSAFSGAPEALDALDHDIFDENGTYGFRYEMAGITEEQRNANMQIWRDFYRFIVNSTDEEFVSKLGDWVILDSALYFYLFTERYTMIDNRAKNTFWHYAKCEDGRYRFDFWDYDNDTGLGINNSGELTMTYGREDSDYRIENDPSSGYVFNAAESTFFCRIRDLMYDQLSSMFIDRESQNCWSAASLISQFDDAQAQFPEELWRLDIERKYLRTYREGNTRFLVQMMNGRKKYQRRQFERSQEKYMASKYFGTAAASDQIMFRCNTPVNAAVPPDYTLHLTPYADMYLSVMFGATYRTRVRAKAGQQYDISCPFTAMDDTAILIYCSSQIQSIGDISSCYIHDNDFSKAKRLQELIIGSSALGYQNTFLTSLNLGTATLLKRLDIQNTPRLSQALDLSSCGNLEELYAYGSGLTGVTFADGGRLKTAELPAITAIAMRNLSYLTDLSLSSFHNLTTLVIENCASSDAQRFFKEAPGINRVRITGIRWTLENTELLDRIYKMYGIDKNGYNTAQSVVAGTVHVPVMREQRLADYRAAWPELEITYDTLINQFTVTFVNDNGAILDVQYVDKGETPTDPITRTDHPIDTPIKESTVSTDFTFRGWDTNLVSVFSNQTITAVYSESLRKYTVKYVSRGTVLQESSGEYGSTIFYHGDTPVYTAEEAAFKYYLFSGWDQSGYINGAKTINAVYDSCEYSLGYFDGRDLSDLRPVEIYAMIKLGIETEHVELKDSITFELGNDYHFEDIEEHVLISEKTEFTGSSYVDTGISIFDEDRDFVLAIDFMFGENNTTNAVLAQCYQSNGANGFRLWYNNEPKLSWGTSSVSPSAVHKREMLVIRHVKGEHGLHVYMSNLAGAESAYTELSKTKATAANAALVFGCAKADDGAYENYAKGTVYWSKLWFADLGDEACKNLAAWTHETRTVEMCGFRRYYLSDNSSKRCSMTFLDSHLLSRNMVLHDASTNSGGWASCKLNHYLNSRLYHAMPVQWKQLIKQVQISSSIGDKSTEISNSDCYIAIPSVIEAEPGMTSEPYVYEGTSIPYLTTNQSRICTYDDGTAGSYWLRSPNVSYSSYYYRVDDGGGLYGYYYAYNEGGVRIMFSI